MNNGTRLLILASQIPILVAVGYQGGWLVWASGVAGGAVLTVAALIIVDSLQRRYRP
jgi:short subunit fatty acids transporter